MSDKVNGFMQMGSRLSVCRQNKNMTQEELAYRLGITPQALSKWERGISLPDISRLVDISQLLEVSADYLLGIGVQNGMESDSGAMQLEIGNHLRNSLEPLELIFGIKLVSLFTDNQFVTKISKLRKVLSYEGILLPIVRIKDEGRLGEQEFMVLSYGNVLYSEVLGDIGEGTVDTMLYKLGDVVKDKYYEVINPDIVKSLVDNLRVKYPALTEGIVPEQIPYSLLTEVMRKVLAKGAEARYLPKVIEIMDCALYQEPGLSVEELAGRILPEIKREDSFNRVY